MTTVTGESDAVLSWDEVSMAATQKEWALGSGRYSLERRFGSGESASLWWARERVSGRVCVVCLVEAPETGPDARATRDGAQAKGQAESECARLANLMHQNQGDSQGPRFFVLTLPEEVQAVHARATAPTIRAELWPTSPQWLLPPTEGSESDESARAPQLCRDGVDWADTFSPSTSHPGAESLLPADDDAPTLLHRVQPPKWQIGPRAVALALFVALASFGLVVWLWPRASTDSQLSVAAADREGSSADALGSGSRLIGSQPELMPGEGGVGAPEARHRAEVPRGAGAKRSPAGDAGAPRASANGQAQKLGAPPKSSARHESPEAPDYGI
jgi:hypothetical protein